MTIERELADVRLLRLIAQDGESPEDVLRRLLKTALWEHLMALDPIEFERLIGRALTGRGFTVDHVGGAGDQGIDLMARFERQVVAIQCKQYEDQPITPYQMREFFGAITAAKATAAIFITTSTYTAAARDFGSTQGIELIDATNLQDWLVDVTDMNQIRPTRQPVVPAPAPRAYSSPRPLCGNSSCRHEPRGVNPWSTHMWVCSKCGRMNGVNRA